MVTCQNKRKNGEKNMNKKNVWLQKEAVTKIQTIVIAVIIVVAAFVAGFYTRSLIQPGAPEDIATVMWKELQERGTIVVGSSPDWPPFEYLDPATGKFTGFEVELVEMIAARLNLTVEWKEMGFETIIPTVQAKKIDMGVSGFSTKPERMELVQFTMPHSITEGQVVMLKNRAEKLGITMLGSLKELENLGLTCGTQVGTTQEDELSKAVPGVLRTYADFTLALADMKRGAIDSIYSETPITSWWMLEAEQKGEEPIVVVYKRAYWPVAWAVNLDNDIFVRKINGALAEIIAEGTLDELKAKWHC